VRERLRDGKYLGAGDRERERRDTGWGRGRGRCDWHQGKRDRGRAMMRENFLVLCPALIKNKKI
jgi:hypothetical protein